VHSRHLALKGLRIFEAGQKKNTVLIKKCVIIKISKLGILGFGV